MPPEYSFPWCGRHFLVHRPFSSAFDLQTLISTPLKSMLCPSFLPALFKFRDCCLQLNLLFFRSRKPSYFRVPLFGVLVYVAFPPPPALQLSQTRKTALWTPLAVPSLSPPNFKFRRFQHLFPANGFPSPSTFLRPVSPATGLPQSLLTITFQEVTGGDT